MKKLSFLALVVLGLAACQNQQPAQQSAAPAATETAPAVSTDTATAPAVSTAPASAPVQEKKK